MTYQVLARKWRPKKFADLVGQEHVVKALINALDKGRLHHAYMLTGTRGVGKTTIARILAKSLNCLHAEHGEPCNQCDTCRQIDAGRFVDVLEIDAASNTGIDNIREVLENAQYAPTMGRYKVYIIDEVHMLSKSAFNAMLKTLEEPPEHVKFILATTDPQKVPITVLSRCLQFVLRNLNSTQVHDHLVYVLQQEQIAYEDAALLLLGRAAAGSMRDALSLLDQAIAIGSGKVAESDVRNMIGAVDKSYLYALLEALAARDGQALLSKAEEMASCAVGFDSALTEMALLLQRLTILQSVPTAIGKDEPEYTALTRFASLFSGEQIQLYYQCALRGKADLPLAPDEKAGFVMTLLRMLAFAPLAAMNTQRLHGQIDGTQLQNAPVANHQAAATPPVIEQAEPASTSVPQSAAVVPQTDTAPAPAELETVSEPIPAVAVSTTPENVSPSIMHSSQSAVADDEPPPPWENSAENIPYAYNSSFVVPELMDTKETDEHKQVSAKQHDEHTDTLILAQTDATEITTAKDNFPPLTAENWPEILTLLAHRLGAVQLFSQHTAIANYDENSGDLTIALAEQGEPTANRELLTRLAETLSEVYGCPIQLHTSSWQEQSALETPQMRQQRLHAEQQQQAQSILEAQPAVQMLMETFNANWVPESLRLDKE
ncbi:DNA polymerase III subunit gamma/tau [Snodgrassella gandavensis]|uniref:DNA polymerase III subunit gamma/tau n=1 Tax=Snodgrassella gandavensis TaxID=2946698 RepID=UPI001EF52DCD|nr:DNA polymerase III subunit gamma/tau [Snodgrassella gandavensis]